MALQAAWFRRAMLPRLLRRWLRSSPSPSGLLRWDVLRISTCFKERAGTMLRRQSPNSLRQCSHTRRTPDACHRGARTDLQETHIDPQGSRATTEAAFRWTVGLPAVFAREWSPGRFQLDARK